MEMVGMVSDMGAVGGHCHRCALVECRLRLMAMEGAATWQGGATQGAHGVVVAVVAVVVYAAAMTGSSRPRETKGQLWHPSALWHWWRFCRC